MKSLMVLKPLELVPLHLTMIEIRSPKTVDEWNFYYDLRFRILREPLGQIRGTEKNEGDQTGIHFALFENEVILAVARLDIVNEYEAQARFVAVEVKQQGKGLGKKIMQHLEIECQNRRIKKLTLHARESALDFYTKMNYKLITSSHKLFGILQHYLMEKEL
jgi:GNAT superfamily N-acetyltransferase